MEFIEEPWHLELISLALVADDGRELYLVSSEFNEARCNPWVRDHVLPKLPPSAARVTLAEIARQLRAFITGSPEFWADFGAHDWVLFCWAMGGRMIDMPAGWPMGVMDLRQSLIERGLSRGILPPMRGAEHDALHDARHLRDCGIASLGHEDRRPVDPASRRGRLCQALLDAIEGAGGRLEQGDIFRAVPHGLTVTWGEIDEALDQLGAERRTPGGFDGVRMTGEAIRSARARLGGVKL